MDLTSVYMYLRVVLTYWSIEYQCVFEVLNKNWVCQIYYTLNLKPIEHNVM